VPKYRNQSSTQTSTEPVLSQSEFYEALYQLIRGAVRTVLEEVMQQELDEFIQAAAYERSIQRLGQRNGYYTRDFNTTVGKLADLKVPRDRAGQFQTQLFERYQRNDPAITEGIAQMFFSGASQQKVASVLEPLVGLTPSASTVSRVAHDLDSECEKWRNRSLKSHYKVIYFDGVYFPILHQGQRAQTALLVALGIDGLGEKEVLAVRVGGEESLDSWSELITDLKRRGVESIELAVTDGDAGLIAAFERAFPKAKRQRCLTHKVKNVISYLPKKHKKEVSQALAGMFAQVEESKAREHLAAFKLKYEKDFPEAVKCLQEDWEACLTFYQFPRAMQKHIRSTNALEGLFSTIRRRTDSMGVFQNEQSCLLMIWAVVKRTKFIRIAVS
jgi:putative transposase